MPWVKVQNEKEKNLLIFLNERKSCNKFSEASEACSMSRKWLKRLLKKYKDLGVIKWDGSFSLRRGRVKIKRFSWEVFKEMTTGVLLGIFLNIIFTILLRPTGFVFFLGGLMVLIPQVIYSFYRILSSKEVIEVWVKHEK